MPKIGVHLASLCHDTDFFFVPNPIPSKGSLYLPKATDAEMQIAAFGEIYLDQIFNLGALSL